MLAMMKISLTSLMIFVACAVSATNLVSVQPLSNKIIELIFVDGAINYHNLNQSRSLDSVSLHPGGRISVADAKLLANYSISSATDPNYFSSRSATDIGANRRIEQTWTLDLDGRPTHVEEMHIYLFLDSALKQNSNYTVVANHANINSNANSKWFTFNTAQHLSEAVHVNNIGYLTKAEKKFAYVYAWLGDHQFLKLDNDSFVTQSTLQVVRQFKIRNKTNNAIAFTGDVVFRKAFDQVEFGQWGTNNNNFSGADVYECDFSNFNVPGEYTLEVDGVGSSHTFMISGNSYYEPLYYTLKSIYENRSGIPLQTPYAQYNRPTCHRPGVNNFKLYYSTIPHYALGPGSADANAMDTAIINANITGEVNAWGWYQNAGDWDAYWTHSKVPGYLLHLYEAKPQVFDTMTLNLENESSNTFPDILDEARWLIRCYKRCKDSIMTLVHGGTGGVPGGRIFGDNYPTTDGGIAEDGQGSWQDTSRKWVMLGESVHLTYIYAGLSAHLASIMQQYSLTDPEGIDWQLEATAAWNWASINTKTMDIVPSDGYNLATFRMYAAAALYRLSGSGIYEASFLYDIDHLPNSNSNLSYVGQQWYQAWDSANPSWQSIGTADISNDDFHTMAVSLFHRAGQQHALTNTIAKQRIHNILVDGSEYIAGSNAWPFVVQNRACRWGGNWWLPMGIGQGTTPYLSIAALATPQILPLADSAYAKDWFTNMSTTADYFMGCNPLNMCMVSGLSEKSVQQMFHMDSWYCNSGNNTFVKKGWVSYGAMRDAGEDLGGWGGYPAPYKYYYGLNKANPLPEDRPGHERFMPSRTAPLANENTIHQTAIHSILTYGTLFALSAEAALSPLQMQWPGTDTIAKNTTSEPLIIYPNPADDYVIIKCDKDIYTIQIFDACHKLVAKYKVNADERYDVAELCSGVYLVRIENARQQIQWGKIIVR
jgi:endoglucanase